MQDLTGREGTFYQLLHKYYYKIADKYPVREVRFSLICNEAFHFLKLSHTQ